MKSSDKAGYVAVAMLAAPVIVGALYSVAASLGLVGAGADAAGSERIVRSLGAPETWRSLAWTLYTAGAGTALAVIGALIVSVAVQHSRLGRALAVVPLAVPHVAASLAALLLLGQSGYLSRIAFALGWITQPSEFPAIVYDKAGVALTLAFAWKEFPFLLMSALAVLATQGTVLREVAQTLGASRWTTYRRVTWPLLWRGIAPAVIAVFAFLVGQYEMPSMLAPSDPLAFPLLIFERANDPSLVRRGEAHVLGLIALALAGLLVLLHERFRANAVDAAATEGRDEMARADRTHV